MHYWDVFEAVIANVFDDVRDVEKMKKNVKKYLLNLLNKNRRQAGFTLIEMVVVIAIIVILILLIAPNLLEQKGRAENRTNDAFKTTLRTQVELYKDDEGKEPTSFEDLKSKKYLTEEQIKKAEAKKITIASLKDDAK